ncbi:MAG: tRNA (adenine-N1)-methyltransferase [Actinomycetota bacterium]
MLDAPDARKIWPGTARICSSGMVGGGASFQPEEKALLVDGRGRRYLITLQPGGAFHFHRGVVPHDLLIGNTEGVLVRSTGGETILALRPTLAEFVLKMRRGAQVVYPKDIAMILLLGDIYPGAMVVEAGAGSGALTIGLLRAVGPAGRVITYELREDFAALARTNVHAFLGETQNLEIRIGNVYEAIEERDVDRIVLDLPEPWRTAPHAGGALRPGGIIVAYLPTVLQVHRLAEALREGSGWAGISTVETLVRSWHVQGQSVRPDHRMIGHTGFLTVARRISPEPEPAHPRDR